MRTTVDLDKDIAAAVTKLRRERGLGLSEAVNELARSGLSARTRKRLPYRQRTRRLGLKVDVTSVVDALEQLDGPTTP